MTVQRMVIGAALAAGVFAALAWGQVGQEGGALKAGPTGSEAPALAPLVKEEGLKRIEVSAPGEFLESNALYVLTRDISAPRGALSFGKEWAVKITNCIIDLNGHTVTYNTEKYNPTFREVCEGIRVFGDGPVVIRGGAVLQGAGGDPGCHGINLRGALAEVDRVSVCVSGASATNIYGAGGGAGGRVHDCYLENRSTSIAPNLGATSGISVTYTGGGWEIYNNTIIGGHWSVYLAANARPTQDTRAKVHHNRLAPRRVPGVKSPHAVMIYTSNGNDVFENLIDTLDARGINVQMGSKDNRVRHNLVAARYTSNALGAGGYDENRCYGYWERSGGQAGNSVVANVFIVNNATKGDDTSSSVGVVAGTGVNYPEALFSADVRDNVIACFHDDPKAKALGVELNRCGKGARVEGNIILARSAGVVLAKGSEAVEVRGNTLVKPANVDADWAALTGPDLAKCVSEANKTEDAPAPVKGHVAPSGLAAIARPGAVELRWNMSATRGAAYRVYRDGKPPAIPLRYAPFWVDLDVKPGETHAYSVSLVHPDGGESPPCAPVTSK